MTKRKSAAKPEDKNKERIADAKKRRKAAWDAKQAAENTEENSREEFRKFFVKVRSKLNLSQDMEGVIWTHFKSAGFDKKDKFEEGIKHFGYKL